MPYKQGYRRSGPSPGQAPKWDNYWSFMKTRGFKEAAQRYTNGLLRRGRLRLAFYTTNNRRPRS